MYLIVRADWSPEPRSSAWFPTAHASSRFCCC